MTAVPVVSATLTTRTVRERLTWNGWERCIEWPNERPNPGLRERLTVDPAFVVLPEAPDLTCRSCGGVGVGDWLDTSKDCPSCGGTGVSPVYAATWQCRHYTGGPWVALCGPPGHSHHQRRQVVEWRATKVDVVVMSDGECGVRLDGWEHLEQPHTEMPCPMPGVRMGDAGVRLCEVCNGTRRVPLSVPDGVLSWIELA